MVIKTKPRGFVDESHNLEVAYQEENSHCNVSIEDDPIDCLHDDQVEGEEVDMSGVQLDEHDLINGNDSEDKDGDGDGDRGEDEDEDEDEEWEY